jgi:hypothetical protein
MLILRQEAKYHSPDGKLNISSDFRLPDVQETDRDAPKNPKATALFTGARRRLFPARLNP